VSVRGVSARPQGNTAVSKQLTRGQRPKSPRSYFSYYEKVSMLYTTSLFSLILAMTRKPCRDIIKR
jgi:hypothetical protein